MIRRKAIPIYLSLLVLSIFILIVGCGGSGGSGESETDSTELGDVDNDGDGYTKDDCDDFDDAINPGVLEICGDIIDNDCDRDIDYLDSDCEGYPSYPGNVMYFEPGRMLSTTDLNGKTFESGFSFSGWFNITQISDGNSCLIGTTYDAFYISYQGGNNVDIDFNSTGINIKNIAIQKWYNLAVTYDLSTVSFYVNGVLVGTSEASGSVSFPNDQGDSLLIGGYEHYGYATQLKIWDRGLSTDELILEINKVDSSDSDGIIHQWLLNEGTGIRALDSVGGVDIQFRTPYWVDLDGPYEIDHNSMFRVSNKSKRLPVPSNFGTADLNQDDIPDLFYQGPIDVVEPIYQAPLLALQNDGKGNFSDGSDVLIEGGLYFKRQPGIGETIIADLNNDGYDDIFIGQSGQHGEVEGSESNTLLLSHGNSGKLSPSEDTIMSPPCTLTEPEFNGHKPCSSDTIGNIYYPDHSAALVPININSNNHGSTSGDIDNDGDLDIFVGAFLPCQKEPVQPYFLINDGNGNFTANWQMVPNKAFHTEDYRNNKNQESDKKYIVWHLEDLDGDSFLDLVMLGGGSPDILAEHIPLNQFDVEQVHWDESVHDLVAWGTNNGIGENYTILDEDPIFWNITNTIICSDFDRDGDIDIIATKVDALNAGQYLQVFSNNGDRTFADVSQQSIPQDREIAQTLSLCAGQMREIDFNNDQCPDFYQQSFCIENDFSEKPHLMWINNCKGYFTPIERRFVGKIGLMIHLDVDGDGDLDFVSQTGDKTVLEHTVLRRTRDITMDKYIDTDRDGIRDVNDIDDDNDGVNDSEDASPKDKYES